MKKTTEDVLNKIKKLFALAGNNPNQEEAESAMKMAQTLLSRHGLSMAQAQKESGEKREAEKKAVSGLSKTVSWWHSAIGFAIAKNFRCDFYKTSVFQGWGTSRGSKLVFVGLPEDVEVATEVFRLAVNTAKSQAAKFILNRKAEAVDSSEYWNRSRSMALRNDYLKGWINGLETTFRKNVEENALVVVKPEEVKEAMEAMSLRKGQASITRSSGDFAARAQGHSDGSRFNNRKQVR